MIAKRGLLAATAIAAFAAGSALAQYPIVDRIAEKVVQKYQTATCEQLYQERAENANKPKSEEEMRLVRFLREDPQARAEFFRRISDPIVTKMFDCGMIP